MYGFDNVIVFFDLVVGLFLIYCGVYKEFDKTARLGSGFMSVLLILSAIVIFVK